MPQPDGLQQFAARLHPAVLADIRQWEGDAALGKLHAALCGHHNLKTFLDTCAEAIVARRLRQRGCELAFEVPTPKGKACDFRVTAGACTFYLHVKRLDTDRPAGKRLTISSRLRYLERLDRPYIVSVRWQETASDEQMQRLVRSATDFIMHARVGDELVVHDDDGREIGGVLIVAPWEGPKVSLAIGLPTGFHDEAPRIRRLLRRAYAQFMPKAVNVILICSSDSAQREDVENALLGSHIERWDTFPPRGRRIAHGRAEDGFWRGQRRRDSAVAGWFELSPSQPRWRGRLWYRQGTMLDADLAAILAEAFDVDEDGTEAAT